MGKKIIQLAINNRRITLFTVALIVILGFYSYYIAPKQEAPDLNAPVALITTVYPGASAGEVEESVTRKIEDELVTIDGYGYANSYSSNSISTVILRLDYGTNINEAWTELKQKMEDLQAKLPEECSKIEINTDLVETAGMIFAIASDNYSYEELENYAEIFKKELNKIDGVSKFEIYGAQEKEVTINVDVEKLNFYQGSLSNIVDLIKAQNVEIPSGRIGKGESKKNVNTPGRFSSIDEIKETIIGVSGQTGDIIRLDNIADIEIQVNDYNSRAEYNSKRAVLVAGYFQKDKNIVLIGKEISQKIDELKEDLPDNLVVGQVLYQPDEVEESVNDFVLNLVEGILFVIVVVLIGMGSRNAIIVSTAIPISILITINMMNILGIKVHQISIAALIVALGMLVDNAIVISDAIQNRINRNEEKLTACIDGVREVALPVFTSTLTTVAAFLPLLLLSSIAGEYISSIPMIVMISLFSSYLVAVLVIPTMAYIFFKKQENKNKQFRIRKIFRYLLINGIKRKKIVIFLVVVCIIGASLIVNNLGLQFFPKADKEILYIDIRTEKNIDLQHTQSIVDEVAEILNEQAEVTNYTSVTGGGVPKFYNTIPIVVNSPNVAQVMLEIDLSKGNRFENNYQLVDYLQEKFNSQIEGGTVSVKQLELAEPIESPVRVRLTGDSIEKLGEAKNYVKSQLEEIQGAINVDDDYQDKEPEYQIDINTEKAGYYGLSMYDIQKEINIALMGMKASVFKGNEDMEINVKSDIESIDELKKLGVKSSINTNKITLGDIANISEKKEISTIKKYDRDYAVMVTSDVKEGFSPVNIQNKLNEKLKDKDFGDVTIAFDGEREKIRENFGSVGNSAILAILLIYVILLFQFKSFKQPLIILITIPLSGIGSILGLYLFKQPLSFTALFGMVSLMGIVVNNAIVLMDFINTERKKGKTAREACVEATDKRFRPIMLSSITTIMGLTPLVFSGSELFRPMAISLMSGLMVSTLLTLVIIPVVYNLGKE